MYYNEPPNRPPDFGPKPVTPSGVATSISNISSSGGLAGALMALVLCVGDGEGNYFFGTFDPTDFNTESESRYYFRAEDIIEGHEVTVSRVRIIYEDYGPATINVAVLNAQGSPDNSRDVQLGTDKANKELLTTYADIEVTGERPQAVIIRKANSGSVSIIGVTLITDVEVTEQV